MAETESEHSSIRRAAMKRMLRPLVRYWMKGLDTIQDFIDLLKVVFVEIAVEEMERSGSKVNVSRISVVTGLHRIDVNKIYKKNAESTRTVPDVVTRILGRWQHSKVFTTAAGKPRVLSVGDDESEFVELVQAVSKGVSPGSVLFHLERSGAVKRVGNKLTLVRPSFRVTDDYERVTELMAKDVETLITSVQENIESQELVSPNHHIRTEYDNVYVSDLPKIREWLRKEGKRFHKKVRDYLSNFDKDIVDRPEEAGAHVVISGFSLITEPEKEEAEEAAA